MVIDRGAVLNRTHDFLLTLDSTLLQNQKRISLAQRVAALMDSAARGYINCVDEDHDEDRPHICFLEDCYHDMDKSDDMFSVLSGSAWDDEAMEYQMSMGIPCFDRPNHSWCVDSWGGVPFCSEDS